MWDSYSKLTVLGLLSFWQPAQTSMQCGLEEGKGVFFACYVYQKILGGLRRHWTRALLHFSLLHVSTLRMLPPNDTFYNSLAPHNDRFFG